MEQQKGCFTNPIVVFFLLKVESERRIFHWEEMRKIEQNHVGKNCPRNRAFLAVLVIGLTIFIKIVRIKQPIQP